MSAVQGSTLLREGQKVSIIGTHVSPDAARTGVDTRQFASSKQAASVAGLTKIKAFIGKDNAVAHAYYEQMGFETYRQTEAAVCKVWTQRQS